MRISHNMMVSRLLADLEAGKSRLSRYQRMLSSGKLFERPSDAPVQVVEALRLQSAIDQAQQFMKNCDDAINWVKASDSALGNTGDVLSRVRELALSAANSTMSYEARQNVVAELRHLLEHMIQLGNGAHGDRYIFAGHKTTTRPFEKVGDNVVYLGDAGGIIRDLGTGVSIQISVPGDGVFMGVFPVLQGLIKNITQGDLMGITSNIEQLDRCINKVLETRAEMGARGNRLELTRNRLLDMESSFTRLLLEAEGVDYAKVITMLAAEENAYQLALNAGARIIQPSLLDFLR
ncbi:MAG: flagellar hook-associated protein FlgL [Bacillota bacterium]|jgi:flagellar hook-associated protein 3 FlgL